MKIVFFLTFLILNFINCEITIMNKGELLVSNNLNVHTLELVGE